MTTFKNNAKYGELIYQYLDLAIMDSHPLRVREVLSTFDWQFKGGSLEEAAAATRLKPVTSRDSFPDGNSRDLAAMWPKGEACLALRQILTRRTRIFKRRARDATLGTWLMLTASYGAGTGYLRPTIISGMQAIYHVFGELWEWAAAAGPDPEWSLLQDFTQELTLGLCAPAMTHMPTALGAKNAYSSILGNTRLPALMTAWKHLKEVMMTINSSVARTSSRTMGRREMERLEEISEYGQMKEQALADLGTEVLCTSLPLGGQNVRVGQGVLLWNIGRKRYALSQCDVERLHQLVMSAMSCLVGCVAQAVVGTRSQKEIAQRVVTVAQKNIERIIASSKKVEIGREVLVCKGYRRAYTAHLGYLAGPLCREEFLALKKEAEETAGPGVLDVEGYLSDLASLDAAGSLNAGKVFKICPAPDVSPGAAMMDRISQIGNANTFDPDMEEDFRAELRSHILRAYIRTSMPRLPLRDKSKKPEWHRAYLGGDFDKVPSMEIHKFLKWESTASMPEVSPYDARYWKDASLPADTIALSEEHHELGYKKNMLTRLLFDSGCPMPGSPKLSSEHVVKFFIKAEGHKDPARGIFSANLTDRQAQSWMELGVEQVARHHPSFMISASVDERELRVKELVSRPVEPQMLALYYSFDISGWSAKMPREPQRISHSLWAELYSGHLYTRATKVNEGAHIYLALEGYAGWFQNTGANLEGFNGKEMTMILITLLSLSVKVWRKKVVEEGIMREEEAKKVVALLLAYIDDGLSRIDLPRTVAIQAFDLYKRCVIETFDRCGFTVETSKCFPSERFAIFLNEVYLGGRHVVHGVRAAMGISSEPTERHTTLVERVSSVTAGVRGAVMAGLSGFSGLLLMSYHTYLHIREWTRERRPIALALWAITPRAWGGLGVPNLFQICLSGSGSAFEEGLSTMQKWARYSESAKALFLELCKTEFAQRTPTSVMTAPLSARVSEGYMVDSHVASMVRDCLMRKAAEGRVSPYARRLLLYADRQGFDAFSEAIVSLEGTEVIQEQMLDNVYEAHPHSIFSSFAKRVEKSETVGHILGRELLFDLVRDNRREAEKSMTVLIKRLGPGARLMRSAARKTE